MQTQFTSPSRLRVCFSLKKAAKNNFPKTKFVCNELTVYEWSKAVLDNLLAVGIKGSTALD